jgi:hypothetical protein
MANACAGIAIVLFRVIYCFLEALGNRLCTVMTR